MTSATRISGYGAGAAGAAAGAITPRFLFMGRNKHELKQLDEISRSLLCINAILIEGQETFVQILTSGTLAVNTMDIYGCTALMMAAWTGNDAIVLNLLSLGADPSIVDLRGRSAAMWAAAGGHKNIRQLLITKEVEATGSYKNYDDYASHLITAVETENLDLVRLCLEIEISPDTVNVHGQSALMLAVNTGNIVVIDLLLASGANVDHVDRYGCSAMSLAIYKDLTDVAKKLLEKGANPNSINPATNYPVLLEAVKSGKTDIVSALLEAGAKPNTMNPETECPILIDVIQSQNAELTRIFLRAGASPNITDRRGNSALIIMAQQKAMFNIIFELLERKYPVSVEKEQQTALLKIAIKSPRDTFIRKLIELRVIDVNVKNEYGNTILWESILCCGRDIVEQLLQLGADVNMANDDGNTPIMAAAKKSDHKLVKLLLSYGAQVNTVNHEGKNPLLMAAIRHSGTIIQLLMEAGAQCIDCSEISIHKKPVQTALEKWAPLVLEVFLRSRISCYFLGSLSGAILPYAIDHDDYHIFNVCLESGVNVNPEHPDHNITPLQLAVCQGRSGMIVKLLEAGAQIEVKAEYVRNILEKAVRSRNRKLILEIIDALDLVAIDRWGPYEQHPITRRHQGCRKLAEWILLNFDRLNIALKKSGHSPFIEVATNGSVELFTAFLEAGALEHTLLESQTHMVHFQQLPPTVTENKLLKVWLPLFQAGLGMIRDCFWSLEMHSETAQRIAAILEQETEAEKRYLPLFGAHDVPEPLQRFALPAEDLELVWHYLLPESSYSSKSSHYYVRYMLVLATISRFPEHRALTTTLKARKPLLWRSAEVVVKSDLRDHRLESSMALQPLMQCIEFNQKTQGERQERAFPMSP